MIALDLVEVSAKVRTGPPDDPPRDREWPVWAGVIPFGVRIGRPIADAGLPQGIDGPPRLRRARGARR